MTSLLVSIFAASLVGSLHCAGMCGGIVALCVGGEPVARSRGWPRHVAYNLGRLIAYATLGAASGAIGAAIDLGGKGLGVPRLAAYAGGVAMILFGAVALLRARGASFTRVTGIALPAPLRAAIGRGIAAAAALPAATRGLVIGLLTAFLPCGWLYAFVVVAAGTGSVAGGALAMTAFWAGTVPVLLALGLGLERLAAPVRRHVPTLTACALILVGVIAVAGRLATRAYAAAPESAAALGAPEERLEALEAAGPPCCDVDR